MQPTTRRPSIGVVSRLRLVYGTTPTPADQPAVNSVPLTEDDVDAVRAELAERHAMCVDRLEDAVAELIALHGLVPDEIRVCVENAIAAEGREPGT